MASFKKNDEGVSAVIGVILMVAITVILAAVIAAFVFQLGGSMPTNKNVAVTVERVNATHVYVKNMGGQDANQLIITTGHTPEWSAFNVTVNGATVETGANMPNASATVGSIGYYAAPANAQISVVANFQDNTQQIIYSGTV